MMFENNFQKTSKGMISTLKELSYMRANRKRWLQFPEILKHYLSSHFSLPPLSDQPLLFFYLSA